MAEVTADTIADLLHRSASSARRRQHLNIHDSYQDPCQRFLNALQADSYIQPHRHTLDPKEECIVAVSGAFALIKFDDQGAITKITPFATEAYWITQAPFGVIIPPRQWHTIVAISDMAVLLEVKAGPFNPDLAKEPAPWAPGETERAAADYLMTLRARALVDPQVRAQLTLSARP